MPLNPHRVWRHFRVRSLLASVAILATVTTCGGTDSPAEPELDTSPADTAATPCKSASDCPNPLDLCIANTCQPQTACKTDKQCTALGLVCDQDKGACVQCLVDADCPGTVTTCKAQTCQDPGIACTTSKMCPEGQVCSKASGMCVFCEGDDDCDVGQYCLDTICKPDDCTAGQAVCLDAATRKTCLPNGSGWTESKCASDLSCIEGECTKVICTPAAKQCSDTENGIVTCNANGTAWGPAELCPSDASCKDAVCVPHVCVPNAKKCDDKGGLAVCAADGMSTVAQACPLTGDGKGQTCVTEAGVAVCKPQACVPGSSYCDGQKAMNCAVDGLSASLKADCSLLDAGGKAQLCLDGGCVSAACKAGDKMCADAETLATCNAAGNGYDKTACGNGKACDNSACVASVCVAGLAMCDGQKAVKCNDSGTATALVADCAATGKVCLNGGCASKVCTGGQATCQGAAVGVCKPDGTGWTLTPCGANEVCTGAKCVAKVCEPGLVECLGKAVRACNGSGSAWVPVQDCATTNQTCLDGECVASACTAGAVGCDGKKLTQCNATGTGWTSGEDCGASGKVCIDGKCSAAVCAPGALKCEGNKVSTCNAGATAWVTGEDCGGTGKVCVEGKCAVSVCTAGALGCDGKKLTQCNATGTGWTSGEDCGASGKVCIEGKCLAALCAPGALKCEGNKVATCNAGATAWVVGTDCAAGGKVCVEGKCAVCGPGTSTCVNGKAGVCKADGSGWSETSCDDGNSCTADSCGAGKGCVNVAAFETADCGGNGGKCLAGVCVSGYSSCKALLVAKPGTPDGLYPIDPDGAGPIGAANLFCDMKNGGLTLVGNFYDSAGDDMPNETSYVVSGWQQTASGSWANKASTVDRASGGGTGSAAVSMAFVAALKASAGQQNLKMCFVHKDGYDTTCRSSADGTMTLVSFNTGNPKLTSYSSDKLTYTFSRLAGLAGFVDGYDSSKYTGPNQYYNHCVGVASEPKGTYYGFGANECLSPNVGLCDSPDNGWYGVWHGQCSGMSYRPWESTNNELGSGTVGSNLPVKPDPSVNTYGFRLYIGPDPVCGNGIKEGLEECDDGNQTDTDECTNACKMSWKLVLEENFDDGQAQGWTTCHGCAGMGCPTVTGGYYFMKGDWNVVCPPVDVGGKAGLAFEYDIVFANAYEVGWWLQGHALVNLGAQLAGNLKVCSNDQGASYSKAPQLVVPVQGTKAHVRMEASFADSRYRVWADNVLVMDTGAGCVTSAPYALRVYAKAFTNANAQVDNFKAWTR